MFDFNSVLERYTKREITLNEMIDIVCSHLTDSYTPKVYKSTANMTTGKCSQGFSWWF